MLFRSSTGMAALAAMPVLEVTAAFVTRGESTLLGDKARALR